VIEKLKHEDKVCLEWEKLESERERIELQRRTTEQEVVRMELQCWDDEECILTIDLESVSNERLCAYYKKLQDDITKRA
jgi:hypothetical protein